MVLLETYRQEALSQEYQHKQHPRETLPVIAKTPRHDGTDFAAVVPAEQAHVAKIGVVGGAAAAAVEDGHDGGSHAS